MASAQPGIPETNDTDRPETSAEKPKPSQLERWLSALMARFRIVPTLLWTLVFVLWIAALAIAYLAWGMGFPKLWAWAGGSLPRGAMAILGSFGLLLIPIWGAMIAYAFTAATARASVAPESVNVQLARQQVQATEEEALGKLESTDTAGLLPLLRYSRAQLDAYYAIGLEQGAASSTRSSPCGSASSS